LEVKGERMNAHESPNLNEYLTSFLTALNQHAATEGAAAFDVQVLERDLDRNEIEKLR
jgi:hypothetical protein